MSGVDYLLHESSAGYAIFKVIRPADTGVGNRLKEVQDSVQDLGKLGKLIRVESFAPFSTAAQALENANDISEGIVSEFLKSLLELNLPKASKKHKVVLGVSDRTLAGSIKAAFPGLELETGDSSETVGDLLRGIRLHAEKLLGRSPLLLPLLSLNYVCLSWAGKHSWSEGAPYQNC